MKKPYRHLPHMRLSPLLQDTAPWSRRWKGVQKRQEEANNPAAQSCVSLYGLANKQLEITWNNHIHLLMRYAERSKTKPVIDYVNLLKNSQGSQFRSVKEKIPSRKAYIKSMNLKVVVSKAISWPTFSIKSHYNMRYWKPTRSHQKTDRRT